MGGRWSLVQIQSPRPFARSDADRPRMLAFIAYVTADLATRLLPARLADRLAVGLARAWFALSPPARRRLEANLARLRPRLGAAERRRTARLTFEQFALSITDFLRLPRLAD